MPSFLIEVMGKHVASPAPISTTVKSCLSDFKRTHQDSWVESQKAFTTDQLAELQDMLIARDSYLCVTPEEEQY